MSKAEWESGNSTRSGLLWEVERILKELPEDELPQVLLMENVPQVHAEKNKEDFENWCKFLRSKGYFNQYIDLNAKNYGIPQNRERCFMVSMLSDEYVEIDFPEEIPLETVMKDYLEDEVDEKYYINSEKAQKLIAELIERRELPQTDRQTDRQNVKQLTSVSRNQKELQLQIASAQESIAEFQTCNHQEAVLLNGKTTANMNLKKINQINTDIAVTLCARDYKGYGTGFNTMNGVIEWQK